MPAAKTTPHPPALDPTSVAPRFGAAAYPEPFRAAVAGREKRALGDALGLTRYGVNLVRLPPETMSSQRHWHSRQDEFVYVLEGELVLVTDEGEQALGPGMVAGFPANSGNGHHLVNRSGRDAVYLEVGDRTDGDETEYPDIDMQLKYVGAEKKFIRRDGTTY